MSLSVYEKNQHLNALNDGRSLGIKGFNPSPSSVAGASSSQSLPGLQAPAPQAKSACASCRAAGKTGPCPGHGGSSDDNQDADGIADSLENSDTGNHASADTLNPVLNLDANSLISSDVLNQALNRERLEDAFEFTVNLENGSLTISPKPGGKLTPEEIATFFGKLEQHFDAFQKQFPEAQGFARELVGHTMTYTIPEQHYAAFIQSLVKEGLAPSSVLQQLNDVKAQQATSAFSQQDNLQRTPSPLQACSLFAFKPPAPAFGTGTKADEEKNAGYSFGSNAAAAA